MKKNLIYFGFILAVTVSGCTKNFDQINTDPKQASAANFDPNLLLPTVELSYVGALEGYSGNLLFQGLWIQALANAEYPAYYTNGDKYVASGNILSYDASIWNGCYSGASTSFEIQNLTKGNAGLTNLSGIALIMQLLNLELVTDVYGDCPYSQALQAKLGIAQPAYDKQKDIYTSMLSRLDSVTATLDAAKPLPTNDIIYKGNIAQWKKFGYSLMLRMAMRLTKADAATAQKYAEKAAASGTFASIADNAFITFDNSHGFNNSNSGALQVPEDFTQVRWGKRIIDMLKTGNDPRLGVVAEIPKNGTANNFNESLDGDRTVSKQIGMPNGYDQNGGSTDISKDPNYPGVSPADPGITGDVPFKVGLYSRPTTAIYVRNLSTPAFLLTYAETELLLAEAAVRGWSVGATAAVHYSNGVSGALQSIGTFSSAGAISAATANSYAMAHPLMNNSLQQINEQYWLTTGTLFNFVESWNNWRRSGFPALTAVNYTGNFTGATIPRREIYPVGEASTNGKNYSAAAAALTGGDQWTSKVWWDQ